MDGEGEGKHKPLLSFTLALLGAPPGPVPKRE